MHISKYTEMLSKTIPGKDKLINQVRVCLRSCKTEQDAIDRFALECHELREFEMSTSVDLAQFINNRFSGASRTNN